MIYECQLCDIAITSLLVLHHIDIIMIHYTEKNLITLIGNLVDKTSMFVEKNNDVE